MRKEIPWGRVLVEGIVIVGSILLAFGIEAWWSDKGERDTERAELERIRDELIADRPRVQGNSDSQGQRAAAGLEVIRLLDGVDGGAVSTVEVPDTLLALLVTAPTFEARTPALDGLRQSGAVAIIGSPEVRAALAGWERQVINVSEAELDARRLVYDQLIPALIERGDVGHVLRDARQLAGVRGVMSTSQVDRGRTTRLRADLELRGVVSQRYFMTDFSSGALAQAVAALDDLVVAIEQALEL